MKKNFRRAKTKVGEKSFNKIIKAGKILFAESGYHSTSINDIIAKAKVAVGTYYIYFNSKLALYHYLLDEYQDKIRESAREATKGLTSRKDIERAGLKAFIMYVIKEPLAYKLIWESLFVNEKIFKDYYQSFSESYVENLQKHLDKGELRDDIDLETVSFILMGIANFVGLQILFKDNPQETDVDFVVNETMKLLNRGLFN
ncbi:MAG: TetR/AcrR family transcriptional regulator [Candidatus Izimaplasma sp.]|nr:TetR/AcrR family transcriptional regulator [Candidatus Izimaplasma bacterium]